MNRFLQALIAISGLAISGLLGFQSLESDRRQEEATLVSLISAQLNTLAVSCNSTSIDLAAFAISELPDGKSVKFQELLDRAVDECGPRMEAAADQAEAGGPAPTTAPSTTVVPNMPPIAQTAPAITDQAIAPAPSRAPQVLAQSRVQAQVIAPEIAQTSVRNLELKSRELSRKIAIAPDAERKWYAVLASYKVGTEEKYVAEDVAKFTARLKQAGVTDLKPEVYRTSVSDLYVVVLSSPDGGRDEARTLVARAREMGLSADAFVQEDRNWTLCPATGSVSEVATCSRQAPPPARKG